MNNDPLARAVQVQTQDGYQTRNDPPEGDTTSEGGYGNSAPNTTFSPLAQRRADKARQTQASTADPGPGPSLIDQSLDGGPLSSELQDAAQGRDPRAREAFAHAAERDFGALNPYGRNPDSEGETREGERGERLASAYADARGRQFESGPAGGAGEDVGAF